MDGPPSFDAPPSMDGPPSFAGPPSLDGPPSFDAPPSQGPPNLTSPPRLDAAPAKLASKPAAKGPEPKSTPPSREVTLPPEAEDPDLTTTEAVVPDFPPEPVKAAAPAKPKPPALAPVPPRADELEARARLFQGLLDTLGASVEQPPDPSLRARAEAELKARLPALVNVVEDLDVARETSELLAELFEAGPLTALLADAEVRGVVLRGPRTLFVDRGSGPESSPGGFASGESVALCLRRLIGARPHFDVHNPWLDQALPDGSRLRAAHVSVAPGGPVLVVQRPRKLAGSGLAGAVENGVLPAPIAELLSAALRARVNLLVCLDEGVDGSALASSLADELAQLGDPSELALVRTRVAVRPPLGAMVFDTEPGLASLPISLACSAGARRMLVEHGSGASIAAALAARSRVAGLDQLVLTIDASDASAGMQACLDGLILAGHGRDRSVLCRNVAATIDMVLVVTADPTSKAGESLVLVGEFDGSGVARPILSRTAAGRGWQRSGKLAFMAEMARRGVTFDAARLTALVT